MFKVFALVGPQNGICLAFLFKNNIQTCYRFTRSNLFNLFQIDKSKYRPNRLIAQKSIVCIWQLNNVSQKLKCFVKVT